MRHHLRGSRPIPYRGSRWGTHFNSIAVASVWKLDLKERSGREVTGEATATVQAGDAGSLSKEGRGVLGVTGLGLQICLEQRSSWFRILSGLGDLGTWRETNTSEVHKRQRHCACRGKTQPFRSTMSSDRVDARRAEKYLKILRTLG